MKDETYTEMRPNRILIREVGEDVLIPAGHTVQYHVATMGKVALESHALHTGGRAVANLGLLVATKRKAVQLINNAYWV